MILGDSTKKESPKRERIQIKHSIRSMVSAIILFVLFPVDFCPFPWWQTAGETVVRIKRKEDRGHDQVAGVRLNINKRRDFRNLKSSCATWYCSVQVATKKLTKHHEDFSLMK